MDIEVFRNNELGEIRTSKENDIIWFNAKDVCSALDIQNSNRVVSELCNSKGVRIMYTLTEGGNQNASYIDEPNLYRIIFKSRKEFAIKFQDWICEEVIPKIRRSGGYSISPINLKELAENSRQNLLVLLNSYSKNPFCQEYTVNNVRFDLVRKTTKYFEVYELKKETFNTSDFITKIAEKRYPEQIRFEAGKRKMFLYFVSDIIDKDVEYLVDIMKDYEIHFECITYKELMCRNVPLWIKSDFPECEWFYKQSLNPIYEKIKYEVIK